MGGGGGGGGRGGCKTHANTAEKTTTQHRITMELDVFFFLSGLNQWTGPASLLTRFAVRIFSQVTCAFKGSMHTLHCVLRIL